MSFFLFTLLLIGLATETLSNDYQEGKVIQLCGRKLAETLSFICEGIYAHSKRTSKSGASASWSKIGKLRIDLESRDLPANIPTFPFQIKMFSLALIPRKFRKSGGIVDECCLKGCRFNELKAYCG